MLGRAIASVGALLDLRLTVVGGSVALGFGDAFFEVVRAELRERGRLGFVADMRVEPAKTAASAGPLAQRPCVTSSRQRNSSSLRTSFGVMEPTYSAEAETYREKVRAFLAEKLPSNWAGMGALRATTSSSS